jgi:UTP--glucose-1-phosphate uridylyltransferase
MIEVQEQYGGSVIALIAVDPDQVHLYGCAATMPVDDESDLVRVTDLVEKPPTGSAPSNLAVIGRYVVAPEVFDVLRETQPGRGGEIQLTDALRTLAKDPSIGGPVHGVLFNGRRYDTGDRADYLRTIVKLACERDDLGPGFREWLEGFVAKGFSD